jgi:hypothetical protein
MKLVNLTPHPVQIAGRGPNGQRRMIVLPACHTPARLNEQADLLSIFDFQETEVVISAVQYTHAYNLPGPLKDTFYVVSQMVAQAYAERDDLLFPYEIIRNEDGSIFACKQLGRWME